MQVGSDDSKGGPRSGDWFSIPQTPERPKRRRAPGDPGDRSALGSWLSVAPAPAPPPESVPPASGHSARNEPPPTSPPAARADASRAAPPPAAPLPVAPAAVAVVRDGTPFASWVKPAESSAVAEAASFAPSVPSIPAVAATPAAEDGSDEEEPFSELDADDVYDEIDDDDDLVEVSVDDLEEELAASPPSQAQRAAPVVSVIAATVGTADAAAVVSAAGPVESGAGPEQSDAADDAASEEAPEGDTASEVDQVAQVALVRRPAFRAGLFAAAGLVTAYLLLAAAVAASDWGDARSAALTLGPRAACSEAQAFVASSEHGFWSAAGWIFKTESRSAEHAGWCSAADGGELAASLVPRIQAAAFASAVCGDGKKNGGEACDDGNTETELCAYGGEPCKVCDRECREVDGRVPRCGDSIVDAPNEECDPGAATDDPSCTPRCKSATVHCFGNEGPLTIPIDLPSPLSIALSSRVGCAALTSGDVICWVAHDPSQTLEVSREVASDLKVLVASTNYFCGLTGRGAVRCFGFSPSSAAAHELLPEIGVGPFTDISMRDNAMCGVRRDGTVTCAGGGFDCVPPETAVDVRSVSMSAETVCVLTRSDDPVCWHCDEETTELRDPPSSKFKDWKVVPGFACGVTTLGTLSWLGDAPASLGRGAADGKSYRSVWATQESICAVTTGELPYCWGAASGYPGLQLFSQPTSRVAMSDNAVCFLRPLPK